jgi:hypothetical protein
VIAAGGARDQEYFEPFSGSGNIREPLADVKSHLHSKTE